MFKNNLLTFTSSIQDPSRLNIFSLKTNRNTFMRKLGKQLNVQNSVSGYKYSAISDEVHTRTSQMKAD